MGNSNTTPQLNCDTTIGASVTNSLKEAVETGADEHDITKAEIVRQGVIAWLVEFTDHELSDF